MSSHSCRCQPHSRTLALHYNYLTPMFVLRTGTLTSSRPSLSNDPAYSMTELRLRNMRHVAYNIPKLVAHLGVKGRERLNIQ